MPSKTEGNCDIGRCFGVPASPCLSIRPAGDPALSASLIDVPGPLSQGREVHLPARDAYFLMIYLAPATHADILPDGTRLPPRLFPAQTICLVDLKEGASILLQTDLRAIAFVCPKALLKIAARLSESGSARLTCLRGKEDPVIGHLADALLPLFRQADGEAPLLRHIAMALCAHLVHTYGLPDDAPALAECSGCMRPDCSCGGARQ
ncbi:hypothetical protein [Labrenzia sp. 011]|uniref:hypothetical protein n=1 Tax=Labrenzia sp. 011 TaxID=2171494 RepID=UPI0010574AC8|nr:hypothetical protein [Labrenzia sp. 011]